MKPTRATQPHRADRPRTPSTALTAMLAGRGRNGQMNAADITRTAFLVAAGNRARGRRPRPPRAPRAMRPVR